MCAWSGDWNTFWLLRKPPVAIHFQISQFLQQYVLIALDFVLAKKMQSCFWAFLFVAILRDTHFVLQKVQLHKKRLLVYKKIGQICMKQKCLDHSELSNILRRYLKNEYFAKSRKKADEQMWISSSYPFKHKSTLQCAERETKLPG